MAKLNEEKIYLLLVVVIFHQIICRQYRGITTLIQWPWEYHGHGSGTKIIPTFLDELGNSQLLSYICFWNGYALVLPADDLVD